ncbi:MAG: phosphate ABC transporter phosphate-binding protein [Firmicutes bacterium HGW-Firmicutes-5]|nr:MAG: phosphate ABC transporter phosphate-binding protein [Firmicutes bacterium HGW-Firmicutes-5]
MKKLLALLLVGVLTMSLAACGSTEEPAAETTEVATETEAAEAEMTEAEEVELEGAVIVDGSGTVYPLMANIAEEYMVNEEENVSVQVGRAGSSAGFKKFIPGELDFSDASRAIKDEEIAQLKENGYEMGTDVYEFMLAYDGLTMVINKENTWATEMTKEEIINMYLASGNVTTWADIRPEWPAEEIKFYGPNENHGTYEFFYETILDEADMVASANLQQDYSTLVDLVANDVNAIAFFGFGYYVSNTDTLQAVKVDFGNGPVEPKLETIGLDLDYAGFTRPVFTYLNVKYALEKPQVLDFAKYVVSLDGAKRLAGDNGFAPLPDAIYEEYQAQLDALK